MSTSLIKRVGLYLAPEAAHRVLVPDARDRVAEAAESASWLKGFAAYTAQFIERNPQLTPVERVVLQTAANEVEESLAASYLQPGQPVCAVWNYDDFKGFLFRNIENIDATRRNHPIDLLEQSRDPVDWHFKAQALTVPVHSWGGYRPVGRVPDALATLLVDGIRLPTGLAERCIKLLESAAHPESIRRQRAEETFAARFRPEVDPLIHVFARKLELVKIGVSMQEFEAALVPSILTTWS